MAVRAPGKNSIAPTWTRRCDPDHRHAPPPGPSPVLRVWPAMDGRDPRPRSLSRVWPAGGDRPGPAFRCRPDVTPCRSVSRPRRIGPPARNPDARPRAPALACHRCHPPASDAAPPRIPAGQCTRTPRISRSDRAWQISTITRHERDTTPTDRGPRRRVIPQKRQENAPTLRKNMGQCTRDSNRAIARHLHQDVYQDRHRDTRSPNGALTGAYSGTGTRKAARFPEKKSRPMRNNAKPTQQTRQPFHWKCGRDLRRSPARDKARHSATSRNLEDRRRRDNAGGPRRSRDRNIAKQSET